MRPRGDIIGALKVRPAWLGALVVTSHPGPSLVLTAMMFLVALAADLRGPRLVLFVIGVLAGELSIGWSNDLFDAQRDAVAGRRDKPLAMGKIGRRPVAAAAVVSLVIGVVLCFVVGRYPGVINLVMMAAGWAYNVRLKSVLASGLAYVVGFGAVPEFAASTNAIQPHAKPWALAAAALLGLGGHFANSLPDLAADRRTDVRGLPQRVAASFGELITRLITLALLLTASMVIVFGPGRVGWPFLAGLSVAVLLVFLGVRATGRWPFFAALGVAAVDVVLFALHEVGG